MLIGVRGEFRWFSIVFGLFLNIWAPGKARNIRASFDHNATTRRIDPRHPDLPIFISKISIFFDFRPIYTSKITDFKYFLKKNMIFRKSGGPPRGTKIWTFETLGTSPGTQNMDFRKSRRPPRGRKMWIFGNLGDLPRGEQYTFLRMWVPSQGRNFSCRSLVE